MNKADRAEELFRMGYNCSQSVYAAFAEELDMSVEEAAKRASPFGAGFGKLREVCGAVSGMVLVLGDLCGYQDPTDAAGETGAVCAGAADVWFLRGVGRQFDLPGPAGACRGRGSGGACGADGGILPESALRGGLQAGGRDFGG